MYSFYHSAHTIVNTSSIAENENVFTFFWFHINTVQIENLIFFPGLNFFQNLTIRLIQFMKINKLTNNKICMKVCHDLNNLFIIEKCFYNFLTLKES